MASATGVTKTFPSPIAPLRAAVIYPGEFETFPPGVRDGKEAPVGAKAR